MRRSSLIIERSLFQSLLKSNSIKKDSTEKNKTVNILEEIQDYEAGRKFAQPMAGYREFRNFLFLWNFNFSFPVYFFGVFFVKRRAPDGRLFYCEVRKQVSDNKTRHTRKIRYSIFEILDHQPTVIVNRPTSSLSLWRHLVIHVTTNATRQKIKSLGSPTR